MNSKLFATFLPTTVKYTQLPRYVETGINGIRIPAEAAKLSISSTQITKIRKHTPQIPLFIETKGTSFIFSRTNPQTTIRKGSDITISYQPHMDGILEVNYKDIARDCDIGDRILIDNGQLQGRIIKKDTIKGEVTIHFVTTGIIRKGAPFVLPDTNLPDNEALDSDDKKLLQKVATQDIDYVMISSLQGIEDVRQARQLLGGAKTSILAVIELQSAVSTIDDILPYVEGIVISRHKLALEAPFENLPILQKELSLKAAFYGKPVYIQGHIFDSMTKSRFPNRAEISDFGNLLFDRVDGMFLTDETSKGIYPTKVITVANNIANATEKAIALDPLFSDDYIIESAKKTAQNSLTVKELEKAMHNEFTIANTFTFKNLYGLDAYKTIQDFWFEIEPLIYLSKLRKPLNLMFESPDLRAIRQIAILYGVKGKLV